MTALNQELLFALRAPQGQSLALLVCALDEAMRDPGFDAAQLQLIGRLLAAGRIPASARTAAEARIQADVGSQPSQPAAAADDDFADVIAWIQQAERGQPSRPQLTLVGSAA